MYHRYEIIPLSTSIRLNTREELKFYRGDRNLFAEIRTYHARGRQIRQLKDSQRRVERSSSMPATPIDWIKLMIVTFEPTLNFGWLRPQYRWIERQVTINQQIEVLNVYPLELDQAINNRHLDVTRWLDSEPPSPSEVEKAEQQIIEFKASQLAPFLSNELYDLPEGQFYRYWWQKR